MRAILVKAPGGPEQLEMGSFPTPEPADDELLVRVKATALNRADLMQREGRYPPPEGASPLLGLELAGTVAAIGAGAGDRWAIGDRVFGLLPGGGYAEYAVLHRDLAMPIPGGLTFEEAAAVPEVFLTAFQALAWIGRLAAGEHVLIHAGASGVGTAAIQLARALGAVPLVTASASKHARCLALGAEVAIDYRHEDFADRVRQETAGRGVDVIVDFIGAPYFEPNLDALATDGRLVLLAMMGGAELDAFSLRKLFARRLQVTASTLRSRSVDYKARLTREFAERMLPLFSTGRLRPVVDSAFDWVDVAEAHRRMAANLNTGKIILRVA